MEAKHTAKSRSAQKNSAAGAMAVSQSSGQLEATRVDPEIADLNFEQAMAALESVTQQLEQGDLPIADALSAYQRGAALMRHAQSILSHVQAEIEVIEADQEKRIDRSALIAQIKD
ncbi:MAG: exodeoxyribonuclease VII small subunit [Burkholderiaceae bacterium]|nr:exodeoxyribonuclease VII small subunit [Burkholderiaceae bacterium]